MRKKLFFFLQLLFSQKCYLLLLFDVHEYTDHCGSVPVHSQLKLAVKLMFADAN